MSLIDEETIKFMWLPNGKCKLIFHAGEGHFKIKAPWCGWISTKIAHREYRISYIFLNKCKLQPVFCIFFLMQLSIIKHPYVNFFWKQMDETKILILSHTVVIESVMHSKLL